MTDTTERTSRAEQKDRTREEIRRAAIDLFESRGFDGTTIDDIAASASVGRRTFFRYFTCKEAVLFTGGIFPGLADDLDEALDAGLSPVRALMWALERDGYGHEEPDELTVRRRRLRVELLDKPAVADYYRGVVADIARAVTRVVQQHPQYGQVRFLPELVGGLLQIMTLEHLQSGETHHFSIDPDSWGTALRELVSGFDG